MVGHVEVVEFIDLDHVPAVGEIVHATSRLTVAAGGGAVAAVALARWSGGCHFYCALGDDELGHRAEAELRARGVTVHAAWRPVAQRRAITMIDAERERTITVIGERIVAHAADPLPWDALASCDAVYITGGDADALRHARRARVVVSTARILADLRAAGIAIDALVSSANDAEERYTAGQLAPEPRIVIRTDGAKGGTFVEGGATQRYAAAPAHVTGDSYGAGDTFAAGVAFALGGGAPAVEAIADASRLAAEVLAWHGPYPP
ncbi:MAG: ribokinase [Deltaproteobacteria bacterium]|nr:ribokinase [Deltaproteobacteria bacterium]